MFSRFLLSLFMIVAASLSAPATAATRLEYVSHYRTTERGKAPVEETYTDVTVIDGPKLYFESRGVTTIIDRSKGEVFLVYHKDKTYNVGRLPFRVVDYVEDQYKPRLSAEAEASAAIVTIDQTKETHEMGPWTTRKVHVEATSPQLGHRAVFDLWMSTDLKMDYETYRALANLRFQETFFMASIGEELGVVDGITIRQELELEVFSKKTSGTSELQSATEVDVEPEAFRPPAGYHEVPLDFSDAFKIKTLPAGASRE